MNKPWFQLGASVVAMTMIANLQYAWTLFVVPLQQGNGWALADVQWAFTLFILLQTWVQPLDGWLIDRLGPRLFITVAGVLSGVGWAALGSASTIPQLYLFYAMGGIGAALVYSGSIGSALKWFRNRRGLAIGHHRGRIRVRDGTVHSHHPAPHRHLRLRHGIPVDRPRSRGSSS